MVTSRALSTDLSLGAQTSYAELYGMAQGIEKARFAVLGGSFHRRQIKNGIYVYFVFRDAAGRVRSVYVGPENEPVQRLVCEFEQAQVSERRLALSRRARACIALGCVSVPSKQFRVIHKLAQYGFFRRGGVLSGSCAFAVMGNMLGLRWAGSALAIHARSKDAVGHVSIALPTALEFADHDVVASLEMGELPIRTFSDPTVVRLRRPGVDEPCIEFITPAHRRSGVAPMPSLGIELHKRPFAELLLEGTVQGVVFAASGACLVDLPEPAQFAIHNLLAHGERSASAPPESIDCLSRAAALIEWHMEEQRESPLVGAWRHALARGPAWRRSAERGLDALAERYSALAKCLE